MRGAEEGHGREKRENCHDEDERVISGKYCGRWFLVVEACMQSSRHGPLYAYEALGGPAFAELNVEKWNQRKKDKRSLKMEELRVVVVEAAAHPHRSHHYTGRRGASLEDDPCIFFLSKICPLLIKDVEPLGSTYINWSIFFPHTLGFRGRKRAGTAGSTDLMKLDLVNSFDSKVWGKED